MQTIYADVLVILNTYVNFALLRLTALIDREKVKGLRIFIAALTGGFYSLIILLEDIPNTVLFFSKIAVSILMITVSFGFGSIRKFFRIFAVFFGVSFVFAGLMFALWLFAAPKGMIFNNGTVYFQFNTVTLLVFTAISYALVRLIFLFAEKHTPKGSIYELSFTVESKRITCDALCDSGSSLRDWYSSLPVILISPEIAERIPESFFRKETSTRLIPADTAAGETMIKIFKPDSVEISGIGSKFTDIEAYIGISNSTIKSGEFKAVIPHALITKEKEKCLKI